MTNYVFQGVVRIKICHGFSHSPYKVRVRRTPLEAKAYCLHIFDPQPKGVGFVISRVFTPFYVYIPQMCKT